MSENDIARINGLRLPVEYSYQKRSGAIDIACINKRSEVIEVTVQPYRSKGLNLKRLAAVTPNGLVYAIDLGVGKFDFEPLNPHAVIRGRGSRIIDGVLEIEGARYRDVDDQLESGERLRLRAKTSWRRGINFVTELAPLGADPARHGLRAPQIGALHAIAAHWSLSKEPAIAVMPTGTGKTEVMLAVTVESGGNRILVVVPTDALRQQTADKYREYGLLPRLGVIVNVANPVVGILRGKPTQQDFDAIQTCNVIVTTMSSISRADEATQQNFAFLFSEVFFDEAHHIQAQTWNKFAKYCSHSRTLLFTATPFREDGKALPGKIIYNYPLQLAQENSFFRPIHFLQVFEPDIAQADNAIAAKAVEKLREDLAAGLNHMMLARVKTISEAERIFRTIYQTLYADLNPVLVHSNTPHREQVLQEIRAGQHRIIICVDMFGEGFDLPQLKVAALHSVHKSLGITLQFIGRFARAADNVGNASFVANTAEDGVPEALESLYQEDADWNTLLSDLSYDAIDPQAQLSELIDNLEALEHSNQEIEISTLTLKPKLSTEVFRVTDFNPENFKSAFRKSQIIHQPFYSRPDQMLVFIVNQEDKVEWTDSRDIAIDNWDLFLVHYVENVGLLFINSTRKFSAVKLAQKICTDPVAIRNEDIFRAFINLRRLVLHSVGLTGMSKNVRYQMFAGLDVRDAIDPAMQQDKMKSNIMGVGYEDGRRKSIGCSRKGKIWSLANGSLADWRDWCTDLAVKLSNNHAAPDDFLRHTLIPEQITTGFLPDQHALMVDWPEQLFESASFRIAVVLDERKFGFHDCEVELDEWIPAGGSFSFTLKAGQEISCTFRMSLLNTSVDGLFYSIVQADGPAISIEAFNRTVGATEFFTSSPPLVRLGDGSQLSGEILLKPREELAEVFDRESIMAINWGDVLLNQESRWRGGAIRPRSIQQKFIEYLERGPAAFIIDDDDNGESADIVAIEDTEDTITITLWHCKYASGDTPGNRVNDLYEVCGQAQKSIKWTWNFSNLVSHLTERELRCARGRNTRFIRGNLSSLVVLRKASRRKYVVFKVGIVQPGLRKDGIGNEHLAILGATSLFLRTITSSPLLVVSS